MEYDVALSFAGEDRDYVEKVANSLKTKRIRVFYDKFEDVNLWGKNLYDYLIDTYRNRAKYTIIFVSQHYANKAWPNLERQAAQARALQENREYVLAARFDETEVPGLLDTTGIIPLSGLPPEEFADKIVAKLQGSIDNEGTKYFRYSNTELSEKALENVSKIRESLKTYRNKSDGLVHGRMYQTDHNQPERNREWNAMTVGLASATTDLMSAYNTGFKVDNILLRDELRRRLPSGSSPATTDFLYDHPTNPLGVEATIDNLESLARMLVP